MFDRLPDFFEISVPDVKLLARSPGLHIGSRLEPCRDLRHPCRRIVRAATKLHYHIKVVFLPASATGASVCFDGFLNESVEEFVESILSVSRDDQLLSLLGKLARVLLLAESLLQLSDRTLRLTGWQGRAAELPVRVDAFVRRPPIASKIVALTRNRLQSRQSVLIPLLFPVHLVVADGA